MNTEHIKDEYASDCNDMIWTTNKQTIEESYHRLGIVIGSGALWINNNNTINLYHAHPIANQRHDPIGLHQTYIYSSLPENNFFKCGTFDDKIRQY